MHGCSRPAGSESSQLSWSRACPLAQISKDGTTRSLPCPDEVKGDMVNSSRHLQRQPDDGPKVRVERWHVPASPVGIVNRPCHCNPARGILRIATGDSTEAGEGPAAYNGSNDAEGTGRLGRKSGQFVRQEAF
jgi:hypothetical protein